MSQKFKVRIKTWAEMEQEFGLNYLGEIDVKFVFTPTMEELMPSDRIIEITQVDTDRYRWTTSLRSYSISEGMIKQFISENPLKELMKNNVFKKTATLDEI